MPSESGKQHRFMEMVAHDPKAAKRVGVPQSVGAEFAKADEGKTFKKPKAKRAYTDVDSKARAEALKGPSTGGSGEKKARHEDDSAGVY